MRLLAVLACLALSLPASAQSEAPAAVFDVADVHLSPPGARESGLYLHANRLELNHPVLDKTGLPGSYDLTMKWTGRGQIGAGDSEHPSISLFTYMEKELGIKVEPQTRPAAGWVIENVNETPSPNPPGTTEKLPPAEAEFEVAEIRLSKPDTQQKYEANNGRIEALAVTMKDLIGFAYNLDDYMMPATEKWMDSEKLDIIAKADPSVTDGTLQVMLRTLLVERFHMKTHFEDQPIPVWALTAPKGEGKLKKAGPGEPTGCVRTPKDGVFSYACRNTTMAQLAARLPNVGGASGYLYEHPLIDLTGLKGAYDFEILWSPPARVYGQGGRGGGASAEAAVTAERPNGGLTIFEAIDKQLGLKLSVEKRSMPVIVIDHIDRITPN